MITDNNQEILDVCQNVTDMMAAAKNLHTLTGFITTDMSLQCRTKELIDFTHRHELPYSIERRTCEQYPYMLVVEVKGLKFFTIFNESTGKMLDVL